ncbi:MAG: permease [Oceanococcaceae bacterium]
MLSLLGSLLMLALGPWIVARATGQTRLRDGVDGFIFVSIAGLVLVDIFPHLFEDLGWWAPLLMALGLWGPDWIEHRFRAAARSTHLIVVLVAACGLVVHTAADGAVLGDLEQGGLSLAVVLHRLPVAMAVWWLLRPSWGKQGALLLLAAMAMGTVAGFAAGRVWLVDTHMTAVVEALVAGSILHVVFNRLHLNPALPAGPVVPSAEGWGNLLGLAFLLVVYGTSLELPAGMQAIGNQLYSLALVAAPAVLLGYLLAGVLTGLVPVRSMAWIGKGSTARQSLNGMLVGLPMPVCSCGVVPLYRSLSQQGVPPAAGLAFLVATPELGLDALIVSLPLLGLDMTLARLIAAALIAWLVGTLLGAWVARQTRVDDGGCGHCHAHDHAKETAPAPEAGMSWTGLRSGLRYGFTDLVDATLPWLILGLLIAALSAPLLRLVPELGLPGLLEVAAFALLGLPVYVCATGSTPIVAVMLLSGVSPGAALAFLITGPATNPATFGLLARMHGRRTALVFGLVVGGLAIACGQIVNAWVGLEVDPKALHAHEEAWWQQLSLILLCGLMLSAVLRRGARALVAELNGAHA